MSNPSDRVLGTPPTNTSAPPENLPFASLAAAVAPHWGVTILRLAQATDRLSSQFDQFVGVKTKADTVKACRELTQELINFLDEIGGDTDQDSAVDDEACCDNELQISEGDDEPSLGSVGHGDPGPIRYFNRFVHAAGEMVDDCEGDEHDGREPENEGGEAVHEDDETSLGWTDEEAARGRTYAGSYGTSADLEEGQSARPPPYRTEIEREPLTVDVSYRRFLRGLTPEQRETMDDRMPAGSGVSLASGREWGE